MQVTLDIPEDLARLFGDNPALLNRVTLEALALEGLRSGKLSVSQGRRLLGISSRYEMDGFLKTKGLLLTVSTADVKKDAEVALSFQTR